MERYFVPTSPVSDIDEPEESDRLVEIRLENRLVDFDMYDDISVPQSLVASGSMTLDCEENEDLVELDWKKKIESGSLSYIDFRRYWAKGVPLIYSPTLDCDCLNITHDEEMAHKILFDPLERYICCGRGPKQVFDMIKNVDNLPSLCGKVFKSGEPTYSCRDCALDSTCVLCVDCFKQSEHRHHRYRMGASGGGGYCDCGDEEAWRQHSFCELHHKGKSQMAASDALDSISPELIKRMRFLMQVVLKHCSEMLTWEHGVSLPTDLQRTELPDTYTTVLFNDETHSFDQVIDTICKAIGCSKKDGIDFTTTIDREGRSIVMCSSFTACNQVRHLIERIAARHINKPLKVLVMHTEVIAHQVFGMKLLQWLQKMVALHERFRIVFSEVMNTTKNNDVPLLEDVMLNDTVLWKAARNQWHQLFITGMLMDPQCKKMFAKAFTKNYYRLIKDFISDDHDHSISITSLSVQIFTVPTVAHALIEEDDAIKVLLMAFLSECERNKNNDGKLAFQRNNMSHNFKRAHYMLYDLKYLIAVIPSLWTDQLRRNFLYGLQKYLEFLSLMQGMDAVVRQVGQHIEYEAEWETGVNLQLRISPIATLMLQWCKSDHFVMVKSFRAALWYLQPITKPNIIGVEIANHSASCIEYDVSSMPVTIHLPLSRFTAGLFLSLEKFGLHFDGPEFQFDKEKAKDVHMEKPTPEHLMELPLRTLVMQAQFRAGMWRRNGYSLLNQMYFYHNVTFREEMFDRDVMMLQVAASVIESNEFLIHVIYKFGLLSWADEKYNGLNRKSEDDNIRQILTVAEEFFALLLTLVSERFTPGIGNVTELEKLKKEIVQLLCIEPMQHSKLFKLLPKDPNNESGMEQVVNEVAIFRKPQGLGTGKYELKPEFLKCFNPFYYHYSREEQSKAEETQLKLKKQANEDLCCPPPVPPEFTPRFSMISNMLQADVMMHILHLVFSRTLNLHCAVFSEAQFEKALHIVGVALHEEERALVKEGDNSFFSFVSKAANKGILSLIEECLKSPRVESHKDLIKWTINKFKYVEVLKSNDSMADAQVGPMEAQGGESSYESKKQKANLAAARKNRIMAQMLAMQKNFIKEHAELFKETVLEDSSGLVSQSGMNIDVSTDDPICLGSKQRGRVLDPKTYLCILCREDRDISCTSHPMVLAAFVQRSSVLSKDRSHQLTSPQNYDPMLFPSDLFCAPHSSTCGHVMHSECWQKYFDSVQRKEQRRPIRLTRNTSFEVDKNEYLCPLCERLSNAIIPIIPQMSSLLPEKDGNFVDMDINDWLNAMTKAMGHFKTDTSLKEEELDAKVMQLPYSHEQVPISEVTSGFPDITATQFTSLFTYPKAGAETQEDTEFCDGLLEMMLLFSQTTYTVGLMADPNPTDIRVPSMSWWSCSYTIHSIESLLREQNKPLFGRMSSRNALCLEAVVRFAGSSLRIFNHEVIRTQAVRLLRFILLGEHYPCCILDLDAFTVLTYLVLAMPVLFKLDAKEGLHPLPHAVGSSLDQHTLHMILVMHIVQILVSYPFNKDNGMEIEESLQTSGDDLAVSQFYRQILGIDKSTPIPLEFALIHCIRTACLPFLRCAALFFNVLTDVIPHPSLHEHSELEFENICHYLGLPTTLSDILSPPILRQLALSWVSNPRTSDILLRRSKESLGDGKKSSFVGSMSVNHLIALPHDYSELINNVSLFTCPKSDSGDNKNPAMCLVCGTVVCSQSYCCHTELEGITVGACTNHSHFCGSGVGVYLRIRDCKLLLLSDKTKGCFMPPPYIDKYGETDQGLVRGNPLHLCVEKYEELNELWLSHNIPEQVSHIMEQSTSLPNWQLL